MAKNFTIQLHVFLRFVELLINLIALGVMMAEALRLFDTYISDELYAMLIASLFFVIMNTFYIQLLFNLRFIAKLKNVTIGLCLYDFLNFIFCKCFCENVCLNKTKSSCVKWILMIGVSALTYHFCEEYNTSVEEVYEWRFYGFEIGKKT